MNTQSYKAYERCGSLLKTVCKEATFPSTRLGSTDHVADWGHKQHPDVCMAFLLVVMSTKY